MFEAFRNVFATINLENNCLNSLNEVDQTIRDKKKFWSLDFVF